MKRLAVLISGNGSNLQAIMDACRTGALRDAQVAVVVSNHKGAYGLERARAAHIPTLYHPLQPYRRDGRGRAAYDADLATMLAPYGAAVLAQAGWMHILSDAFLRRWAGPILNVHPALPGAFPGTHAIERAYEAYRRGEIRETGVMVHLVPDEAVDEGPVVAEERVPILPTDTLETLEARIHATEHRLYVQALAEVLAGL